MGVVYLAEDMSLGRKVALKVLPQEIAADAERLRRFESEARAAAALTHPNIGHIYEIGEAEGHRFIAMEFVDGQTLSRIIAHARPDLPSAVLIMLNVAKGLERAAAAGIIHRDLKPDNVMVTADGQVKILDFGLAKARSPHTDEGDASSAPTLVASENTLPGTVLGTAGYMSPEQARGKTEEVDPRSDIFSFGCILYEMLTGRRAFRGETSLDTLIKVVHEYPTPVREIDPAIPEELDNVVQRCMEKSPDDRYASIRDTLTDLENILGMLGDRPELHFTGAFRFPQVTGPNSPGTGSGLSGTRILTPLPLTTDRPPVRRGSSKATWLGYAAAAILAIAGLYFGSGYILPAPAKKKMASIAVLPFHNETADPDLEYLSDGLTEGLINDLSTSPDLAVMARNSVFRYKDSDVDTRQVGTELRVDSVLIGRLSRRGDHIALNLELVDTANGTRVWGDRYERTMASLPSLEGEVAAAIMRRLQERAGISVSPRGTSGQTQNAEAYQLYAKARYHWNQRTISDLRKSIELFEQATALDPNYSLAYAGEAQAYVVLPAYLASSSHEAYSKARLSAKKALELDNSLAEAHAALAVIYHEYDWDFAASEQEFKRAIDLNPNYATAHHWYAELLLDLGRYPEAMAEIKAAQQLDPQSPIINTAVGTFLTAAQDPAAALEQFRKTAELDPYFPRAHLRAAFAYEALGQYESAATEYERYAILSGRAPEDAVEERRRLVSAFKSGGAAAYWRELVVLAKQKTEKNSPDAPPPLIMATYYVQNGDKEDAIELLQRSYQQREPGVLRLGLYLLDPIRSDPRIRQLARQIGLPGN